MHWKIKRDSFYSELYPLLGPKGIEEAGFFYDTAIKDVDINSSLALNCTPLSFSGLALAQKPAILLCTGAYCPAHEGHIEMMVLAKKALIEAGYDFVGGYLSPGHDAYINDKTGEQAIPIHYRLHILQQLIVACGQGDWLCIDPWEGLFNAVAVNFTDVITRLELYVEKHFGKKIPIFYICGGDNARFSLSFLLKGNCIVLGRPGYEERFFHYKERLKAQQNILWLPANNPKNSSLIRQQQAFVPDNAKKLLLRIEEQDPRETAILALLRPYFTEIQLQYLSEQKVVFDKMDKNSIISLDAMLRADVNLEISRCYDLFGTRFLGFRQRPGSLPLDVQVSNIKKNKHFLLFDDDQHSGATLRFAKEYLERSGVKIENIYTLSRSLDGEETLDCRDFIIGGAQNGLVVQLGADLLRVPYCYPYCCPFVRASIAEPMAFSKAVWRLNADYFREKGSSLSDLAPTWQRLFSSLGFSADASAASICDWHVELLEMG